MPVSLNANAHSCLDISFIQNMTCVYLLLFVVALPTRLGAAAEGAAQTSGNLEQYQVPEQEVESIRKKLRQLALAMLNYESSRREFPAMPRPGEAGLSWRVRLLPYLDQQPLYKQYKHEEPWNSAHNSKLLSKMPDVYRSIDDSNTNTRFMVFSGDGTMFPPGKATKYRQCSDGSSNTIMITHAGATVPWTKPVDLQLEANNPLKNLSLVNDRIESVLFDGSTLSLPPSIEPETFKALATSNGSEIVDAHGLQRKFNHRSQQPGGGNDFQAEKDETMNRFRQLSLAMLNYQDSRKAFPSPWVWGRSADRSKRGPALSWRVAILPYLDQSVLYNKYDLESDWISEKNRPLINAMPQHYRHASDISSSETRVHVITDPGSAFRVPKEDGRARGLSFRDLSDGASNTLLLIEAGPETASLWTQPTAVKFEPKEPLKTLGTLPLTGFPAAMADGSVRWLAPDVDPEVFKAMVLVNDGN